MGIFFSLFTFILFMYIFAFALGVMFKGGFEGGVDAVKRINKRIFFPIIDWIGKPIARRIGKNPRIIGIIILAIIVIIVIIV